MFTILWGLLLWVIVVGFSGGLLLLIYAPILLPALLIAPFLGDEAGNIVRLIALILCGLLTLAIAYQLGSAYG